MKNQLCLSKILLVVFTTVLSTGLFAQEFLYRTTSNIVLGNDTPKSLSLGVSYKFNMIETVASYTINDTFFAFGGYNFNQSTGVVVDQVCFVLCSSKLRDNTNSGYTIGGGFHNVINLGSDFKTEISLGYSGQQVDYETYILENDRERFQHLSSVYFSQFSVTRVANRLSLGLSVKASLLDAGNLSSTEREADLTFNDVFFITPAVDFKFRLLPKANLYLTAQSGISLGLNNLLTTTNDSDANGFNYQTYLLDFIANVGFRYSFDFSKSAD